MTPREARSDAAATEGGARDEDRLGRLFLEDLALYVRDEPMRNEILEPTLKP